jgi:hypothetical protein
MFIISTIKTATVAAGTVAGIWLAGAAFAPGATAAVFSNLQDRFGPVFAVNCETRPAECLRNREHELTELADTLATLRVRLDGERTRSAELAVEAEQRLAANRLYLEEGRRVVLAALPGQTVTFLGVAYPGDDALRQQLALTFAEGRQLEGLVAQYRSTHEEIARARQEIITRRAEVLGELRIIPSLIALVEVQTASSEVRNALSNIEGVMTRARHSSAAADPLLRSTEELMTDAMRPATTEFDTWLRGPIGG